MSSRNPNGLKESQKIMKGFEYVKKHLKRVIKAPKMLDSVSKSLERVLAKSGGDSDQKGLKYARKDLKHVSESLKQSSRD
jgi:hypothetical protein